MSIIKTARFSDGQAIDHVDFNNAQRYQQAMVWDGLLRHRLRTTEGSITAGGAADTHCFFVGTGGGVKATATALRSSNSAGVIATLPSAAAVDGDDPKALLYYLAADELLTNHGAADATLDRWDIVCVKLEQDDDDNVARDFEDGTTRALSSQAFDVQRRVLLTKQVVVGTNAAAGTAVEPAVPSGFVKWAAVFIPATFATVFTPAVHLRDWRIPAGSIESGIVHAGQFYNKTGVTGFNFGFLGGMQLTADGTGQHCYAVLPVTAPEGRVLRLSVLAEIGSAGAIDLIRWHVDAAGTTETVIYAFGHTGGAYVLNDMITGGSAPSGDPLNGPVWARGHICPEAQFAQRSDFLAVKFTSSTGGDAVVSQLKYEVAVP